MALVKLEGNTYPVREGLKALGARWNTHAQCWMIAQELVPDARALIAQAPEPARFRRMIPRERRCKECHQRINYGVYCGKCEFGGR